MKWWEKGLYAHPELDAAAMNGEGLPPRNVPYALYSMMAGAYNFSDANATLTGKLLPRERSRTVQAPRVYRRGVRNTVRLNDVAGGAAEPDSEARTSPLRYTVEKHMVARTRDCPCWLS
jgi:hypothetical protein